MYEELLPFWKARCRKIENHGRDEVLGWVERLKELRLDYEWVSSFGEYDACLVCGVMLFTWEQGIAP